MHQPFEKRWHEHMNSSPMPQSYCMQFFNGLVWQEKQNQSVLPSVKTKYTPPASVLLKKMESELDREIITVGRRKGAVKIR